jgi:hypothetical protein
MLLDILRASSSAVAAVSSAFFIFFLGNLRALAAGLDGKWPSTQVMRLLEAGRPFDGTSAAAVA